MAKMKIKGKVVYQRLGTGFWGIEDSDGNQWRPENLPEKYQEDGKEIEVKIKLLEDVPSIFMWGKPVKIVG